MMHKSLAEKDIISKLPKDLYHFFLFKYLSGRDLKNSQSVCKQWKKISEELLKKTAHQQFYLVGTSIPIATRDNRHDYVSLAPRTDVISVDELKNAFPKNGVVKLFSTENEALNYSYSLRTITDVVKQPAIYKVQFLREIPKKQKRECIFINLNYGQPLLLAKKLTHKRIVSFFETDVGNVVPLSATLKVLSLKDEFDNKKYATFDPQKNKQGL